MLVSFATLPAEPSWPNEDFIAATADTVVLLDGAGIPRHLETGCVHGVPWFVRQLGPALVTAVTADGAGLTDGLARSIDAVRALHAHTCDLDHPRSPSATVVALKVGEANLDYLVLSDSVLILETRTGLQVVTDHRGDQVARRFRLRRDALERGTPEYERAAREFEDILGSLRNRPGGFWVAGTDPGAAAQALTGSVARAETSAAALLSDGATRLVDRFGLASWDELLETLRGGGPRELLRQVRRAEESDPDGMRWRRGKIFDDATAAYCHGFA
jgi:hypothetical protein